jgi:hypothetical protein
LLSGNGPLVFLNILIGLKLVPAEHETVPLVVVTHLQADTQKYGKFPFEVFEMFFQNDWAQIRAS